MLILGLDVARTDRSLVFYENQENLSKLWDILSVYAWFDKDVNYCQGGLSQYLLEMNFFQYLGFSSVLPLLSQNELLITFSSCLFQNYKDQLIYF